VPSASGVTWASKMSRPGVGPDIRTQEWSVPSGRVSTAVAATASWPSRKTVARIGMASPTTALVGQRPPSMTGWTARTGIRPIGVWGVGSGVVAVTR